MWKIQLGFAKAESETTEPETEQSLYRAESPHRGWCGNERLGVRIPCSPPILNDTLRTGK